MPEEFELNEDDIDGDEDFDADDIPPFRRKPEKPGKTRGRKPIENADQIPLFQHADKKAINTVSYIKVIKTSRPGHGYKGQLPPTSTEETLLRTYGPGTFTLQGCNDQHQVIIEQHEVYIAGEDPKPTQPGSQPSNSSDRHTDLAIKMANHQAEESMKRQEETHRTVMKLLTDSSKTSQDTLTGFFEKMQQSQGEFFTAMAALNQESKTQQAQMFQQTIALMTMGHQQSMEFLRASNDRERDQNNPMLMVQLLMQGLQMGRDIGESTDTEPWIAALKEGGGMLNSLVHLKSGSAPTLPNPKVSKPSLPTTTSDKTPKTRPNPVFTKEELSKLIELKNKINNAGLDLTSVLSNMDIVFQPSDDEIPDDTESDDIPDENEPGSTDRDDNTGDSGTE